VTACLHISTDDDLRLMQYMVLIDHLQLVCIIVPNSGDIAAFKDYKDGAGSGPPAAKPAAPKAAASGGSAPPPPTSAAPVAAAAAPSVVKSPSAGGRGFASPLARTLAASKGIDVSVRGFCNL
jgi:pyruvate/2-oxoglutarate dehydrogenase complex dihydrolipoamide acyltransferase (E2) component